MTVNSPCRRPRRDCLLKYRNAGFTTATRHTSKKNAPAGGQIAAICVPAITISTYGVMAERNTTSPKAISRERAEIADGRHSELSDMPYSERRGSERVDNQNRGVIHAQMSWGSAEFLPR